MNTQLIVFPDQTMILVSDEEVKNCWRVQFTDNFSIKYVQGSYGKDILKSQFAKVIAGIPELPTIDLSALSEEEQKRIGWINVEKLAIYYSEKRTNLKIDPTSSEKFGKYRGFVEGFKAAQSLNEKKYSEEDLKKAFKEGQMFAQDIPLSKDFDDFIQSLSQPKVFDVEVDPITEDAFGMPMIGNYPKITNNSIKVLKIC